MRQVEQTIELLWLFCLDVVVCKVIYAHNLPTEDDSPPAEICDNPKTICLGKTIYFPWVIVFHWGGLTDILTNPFNGGCDNETRTATFTSHALLLESENSKLSSSLVKLVYTMSQI